MAGLLASHAQDSDDDAGQCKQDQDWFSSPKKVKHHQLRHLGTPVILGSFSTVSPASFDRGVVPTSRLEHLQAPKDLKSTQRLGW